MESTERLERQNALLLELAVELRRPVTDIRAALNRLARAAARYLSVRRVGVWLLGENGHELRSVALHDDADPDVETGVVLRSADYPRYFAACRSERCIDAVDAWTDPRTSEFAPEYLERFGIRSMLDAPIFVGDRLRGIVCHESVGARRDWTAEEQAFAGSIADLVAQTLTAYEAREATDLIEALMRDASQGILLVREDGCVHRANPQAEAWFGSAAQGLAGRPVADLIPAAAGAEALSRKRADAVRLDGTRFRAELTLDAIEHRSHHWRLVFVTDVTAEDAALQALKERERLYRNLVEDQPLFVLRARAGGEILFVNRALAAYFDVPPDALLGRRIFDFVPREHHTRIREAALRLSPGKPLVSYEHPVIRPDGRLALHAWTLRGFFDESGRLVDYQAIGRDVSSEREREARIRTAQRLEALALLSGGIAHDFNNLLTPILGFTRLALENLERTSEEARFLRSVCDAAVRARNLTRQILTYSRTAQPGDRGWVDPVPVVGEVLRFVRAAASSTIDVRSRMDTDCGEVRAAETDLFQILSNLCTNAIQAMPAGGELVIDVGLLPEDPASPGDVQLQILVSDTGSGIAPEDLERVFEPFYTTKSKDVGTGLGLSVVHALISELGGRIEVQSRVGEGTQFVARLPARREHATCAPDPLDDEAELASEGTETVLVADDEERIVALVRDTLERRGYTVIGCRGAGEALTEIGRDPQRVDLVVTDLTMPRMSGLELCWRARAARTGLRTILMTGYGAMLRDDDLADAGVDAVVHKPFDPGALAARVREVLDRRSSDRAS